MLSLLLDIKQNTRAHCTHTDVSLAKSQVSHTVVPEVVWQV